MKNGWFEVTAKSLFTPWLHEDDKFWTKSHLFRTTSVLLGESSWKEENMKFSLTRCVGVSNFSNTVYAILIWYYLTPDLVWVAARLLRRDCYPAGKVLFSPVTCKGLPDFSRVKYEKGNNNKMAEFV